MYLTRFLEQLQAGQAYDISINAYLDALTAAFDKTADATVAIRDRVTAIEESLTVPATATDDLTVSLDTTSTTVVPAIDPEEINFEGSVDGFSFDLTRIFSVLYTLRYIRYASNAQRRTCCTQLPCSL